MPETLDPAAKSEALLTTPIAACDGLVLLKLFIPPRYYGAYLVFLPSGEPLGLVDATAAELLRAAKGTNLGSLIGETEAAIDPAKLRAVIALVEAGLVRGGTESPTLHWIEPDQRGSTRHKNTSADLFIRYFYDYFGATFREGSPLIDSNADFLPILSKYFPKIGRSECLDAGCGSGFYAAALARLGHTVYACDINEGRIGAAERQPQAPGKVQGVQCNLEDIPLPDASIDFAMCNFVLEHVGDPYAVVEEMVRLLKPGGAILLAVPSFNVRDTIAAHLYGELPSLNFEHLRSYGLVRQTHPWCESTLDTIRHLEGLDVTVQVVEGANILNGLPEPYASGCRCIADQLGPAFATTWPWNCLGQQTVIYGERKS